MTNQGATYSEEEGEDEALAFGYYDEDDFDAFTDADGDCDCDQGGQHTLLLGCYYCYSLFLRPG